MTILKNLGAIAMSIALIALAAFVFSANTPKADATGYLVTNIGSVATTSAMTAVTSSTRLVATTSSPTDPNASFIRVYTTICNANANPVYLRLDGDKATNINSAGYTTVIAAAAGYSVCYEIDDRNQYNGSITASSTNQTSTSVSVTQYVQ